jgi:uncharacterized protein
VPHAAKIATLVAIIPLLCVVVQAQGPLPANDGWVTDLAGLLSPQQEQALETLMESYRLGSGHEIALLTVPDLGGRSLERYALEVVRSWGLGEAGKNNGALMLVAKQERKIRIEVGRGLEGSITDSISGRIIRDVIAPELKRGRTYDGLHAGVEALHAAAGGDYSKIPQRRGRRSGRGLGLFPLLFLFFILPRLLGGRRGRRGRGGFLGAVLLGSVMSRGRHSSGWHGGGSGQGFSGFGGGGGFSGGGASGGW